MYRYFYTVILGIMLASCSSHTTAIRALKPATITIPDHIQSIGTIDRSMPEKGFSGILEGALTGEQIGQDKRGRQAAIEGFAKTLTQTPRFSIRPIATELTGSKDGSTMSRPLSWTEIDKLCKMYQVDAIAALELFDSDQFFSKSSKNESYKDKEGKEHSRLRYYIDRKMEVRTGFRVYDNVNKVIIEEFVTSGQNSDSGNGLTETDAQNNLRNVYDQVREVGTTSGRIYAQRIAPLYETIHRSFIKKVPTNKDAHEKALNAAKAKDWTKAAEIWNTMASQSTDVKTKGIAAYNMAIVCEAQGKIDLAIDWAKKSYYEHGYKKASRYMVQLKDRKYDLERLEIQMKSRNNT